MGEQGVPFGAVGWMGVFAAAGTPSPVLRRLNEEINRIHRVRADLDAWCEIGRKGDIKAD